MEAQLSLKAKKRNLFVRNYSKSENIITEAFIKTLEKSKPSITSRFLKLLDLEISNREFRYSLQVGNNILENTPEPIVLGIAESDIVLPISDELEEGIPDAHIYSKDHSMHILLEVKVYNNRLIQGQLDRHRNRFAGVNQEDIAIEIRTWNQIRETLSIIMEDYDESHRNHFLISEFLDLINEKEEYDIYNFPENEDLRETYIFWHDYIKSIPDVTVKLKPNDSIDFLNNDENFVTIFPKKKILILKPTTKINLQHMINAKLNFQHFVVEGNYDPMIQHKKYSKEGIINLQVESDISIVKEFIEDMYEMRQGYK